MRDFLRLVLVAIVSFVIVGAAFYYSRDSEALDKLSAFASNTLPAATLITGEDAPAAQIAASKTTSIFIPRPAQSEWVGLAGLPDSLELRFPLPEGINLTGGKLVLGLDSQMGADGDGRVTLFVNQTRRGEVVLDPGAAAHQVEIELTSEDLLGNALTLRLAAIGTTSSGQVCPSDDTNSGAAISVSANSGLVLETPDPANGLEVRLATLADPAGLVLGTTPLEQPRAIWTALRLARAGISTQYVANDHNADLIALGSGDAALALDPEGRIAISGDTGISALIAHHAGFARTANALDFPVNATALGVDTSSRNFRGSRRWSLDYKLADLEQGEMPRRARIALRTATLQPGSDWVTRLTLNGNLIASQRTSGQSDTIEMLADLPIDQQGLFNSILVELIDTSPNASICRNGPDAEAQLLPDTALLAPAFSAAPGWPAMVHQLAEAPLIGLETREALTPAQAASATAMLEAFVPASTTIALGDRAADADISLKLTTGARLRAALDLAGTLSPAAGHMSLVTARGNLGPALTDLTSAEGRTLIAALPDNAVAILIDTDNRTAADQ